MPHGYCLRWDPALVGTFIAGNILVAIAYFSIPLTLMYFVKIRRDLAFSWMFVLFGIFIVSCGITHILKIITLYHPFYWAEAWMDFFTGTISLATAILLWPLIPKALALPSPKQLSEKNVLLESSMLESEKLNSELQELNQQLRYARDNAIDASNTKSAFVAAISHELRTPLTAILGMNELLMSGRLDSEQKQLAHNVQVAASSLLASVNDILDLSRLEAGKLELEILPFQFSELSAECLKVVESAACRKNISLKLDCDSALPPCVSGDSVRIKQILINLLSNAVKFTDSGSVELKIELLSEEDNDLLVRFSVIDSGLGIKPADLARIFQPFTQADQSSSRRFGGSGLGLSIANYLAMLMGSRIFVESEPDLGSRFWFELNLGKGAVCSMKQSQQQQNGSPKLPRSKILVVDDDPFLQKLAKAQLQKIDMTVTIAGCAEEVLQMFAAGKRFDLILMDCHMPGQDGYSLTKTIRQMDAMQELPIIAVTAGAMKGDRERCLAAGMNDYLSKPYTIKQLIETLQRWLLHVEDSYDGHEGESSDDSEPGSLLVDIGKLEKTFGRQASADILDTFFQSSESIIQELKKSRIKEDLQNLKALAHRLKGASSMACIEKLATNSRRLESAISDSNWQEVDQIIESMQSLLSRARRQCQVSSLK